MKKLFLVLSLVFSTYALANVDLTVYPRLYYFGNKVEVQIWNHTDKQVTCSGMVTIRTQNNDYQTEYFYDYVAARMTSYRSIYLRDWSDRVSFANHSIYCR